MGTQSQRGNRSRSGCWTCRKRKKKCDGGGVPCATCSRLGIECDVTPKLIWHDDPRRRGMSRRGPPRVRATSDASKETATHQVASRNQKTQAMKSDRVSKIMPVLAMNPTMISLSPKDAILLDHYIQRFSRTYPTCQEPNNPFLSTLLPFAMQDKVVLDALLALSGAQHWESDGMVMEHATLQLRHRALRGCQSLLNQPDMQIFLNASRQTQSQSCQKPQGDRILSVIACCVLLLLYEKLVGNGKSNWMPHLTFLATILEKLSLEQGSNGLRLIFRQDEQARIFHFLYNLFLYNDLVHSTATGANTLSAHYVTSVVSSPSLRGDWMNRFYYPCLVARITAGNTSVTDVDIDIWNGRLDWLPSFSSTIHPLLDEKQSDETERVKVAQLYRYTAKILLEKSARRDQEAKSSQSDNANIPVLADQAATSLSKVSEGSLFENALLWPIGIFARELTRNQCRQRQAVMQRLQRLESRFHMRHFKRMQEVLKATWTRLDNGGLACSENTRDDVFLLG